jgi:hypothetical protein
MSLEAIRLADPEFDRIAEMVSRSYENSCIVQIDRVICINLDYEERKQGQEIQEMFHGTKADSVASILNEGLLKDYNKISALGIGTYFSLNIRTSLSYTNKSKKQNLSYVFLCDVISSDTKGDSNISVCKRDDSFKLKYLIRFYKQ